MVSLDVVTLDSHSSERILDFIVGLINLECTFFLNITLEKSNLVSNKNMVFFSYDVSIRCMSNLAPPPS